MALEGSEFRALESSGLMASLEGSEFRPLDSSGIYGVFGGFRV